MVQIVPLISYFVCSVVLNGSSFSKLESSALKDGYLIIIGDISSI
jgi:hypothetical protein